MNVSFNSRSAARLRIRMSIATYPVKPRSATTWTVHIADTPENALSASDPITVASSAKKTSRRRFWDRLRASEACGRAAALREAGAAAGRGELSR